MSDSLRPLYSPWNSSGQTTGVGSYSLLQGSFQPRDQTQVSCVAGRFFTSWATRDLMYPLQSLGPQHSLLPRTSDVIWKQNFCRCSSLRWRHTLSDELCSHKKAMWRHRYIQRDTSYVKVNGEIWNRAATSQGTPKIAGNHWQLEWAWKDPPLETSEGVWPWWHLHSRFLVSRTVRA